MPTQYEEEIRQQVISKCGYPPTTLVAILNPAVAQAHADCASKVAHEYEASHRTEALVDKAADIPDALLTAFGNPFVPIILVVIIVAFIGWGLKSGIQSGVSTTVQKKAGV